MKRGLRYLPAPRKGRRRLGILGLGLIAAMSLVWQQQATVATFRDSEFAGASFKAATLSAIDPVLTAGSASINIRWPEPAKKWDTQEYRLNWSATGTGTGTNLHAGAYVDSVNHAVGSAQDEEDLPFTAVAAGATHACGIARGTAYCWGTSAYYALGLGSSATVKATPTAVTGGGLGGAPVTAITAGTDFTCALAGGKAYCWGRGDNGQLGIGGQSTQPTPQALTSLSDVTAISAGAAHACAIAGGKVYCWGQGDKGQIGDSGTSRKEWPTAIKTDTGAMVGRTAAAISAGGAHTCAVADGQAFCWGLNSSGQLGDGGTTQSSIPVAVSDSGALMGRTISAITGGANHSCALAGGKAFCWGLGTTGQLGNSLSASSSVPVEVSSVTGAKLIASGANQTCVVAGGVSCWGQNINNYPTAYTGTIAGHTVTAISVGTDYGCVAVAGYPAACAGDGTGHRLGTGSTAATTAFGNVVLTGPTCPANSVRDGSTCSLAQGTEYFYKLGYTIGTWVAPDSAWKSITTTKRPEVTLTTTPATNKVALSWTAAKDPGQSYAEYTVERRKDSNVTAVKVATTGSTAWTDRGGLDPTRDFTQVATGANHTCGIVDERLYCWGQNDRGQLGIGTTTNTLAPAFVMSGVTKVAAGGSHTCALTMAGSAYCWGDNSSGQLGTTATPTNVPQKVGALAYSDISAGDSHNCGVTGANVYCWGLNNSGQLGTGDYANAVTPKKVVDTVKCGSGLINAILCAIGVGTKVPVFTNGSVTTVAAGGAHACVLSSGAAFCWGLGTNGELGNGGTTSAAEADKVSDATMGNSALTALTSGGAHTCAIKAAAAYCWGSDASGQLGSTAVNTRSSAPVAVTGLSAVTAISAGSNHTCAVAGTNASCWGAAANGRLGNGQTSTNAPTSVRVTTNGALAGSSVTAIAAGDTHSCLITVGAAYCWGSAGNGRLGLGGAADTTNYAFAQLVVGDARCAAGSVSLGDGTCSLASGASYQYRVSFTLDGSASTPGTWKAVTVN